LLIAQSSKLAAEDCIYSLQNSEFATDNQKGALSLGRSEKKRYFCKRNLINTAHEKVIFIKQKQT
jgi:hypothetical protein